MNVLIVYAHPSKKSYTFQILEQLTRELTQQNCSVEISDLYAMNFLSDMTESEYDREGFANTALSIPEDVIKEHRKIENADCIIFLYPLWWSDCPAKLKGWFDRVYTVGYAYGYNENSPKMKMIQQGVVICTAGHPNEFLEEIGMAESMRKIMLDDRLGKRFKHRDMVILGGTLNIEQVRELHKTQVKEIAKRINLQTF